MVAEIDKKLVKDWMLLLPDAQDHKDKIMKHNPQLNVAMPAASFMFFINSFYGHRKVLHLKHILWLDLQWCKSSIQV